MTDRISGDYVELHARSAFSFHCGASQPEALAEQAAHLDLSALTLCDRDGVQSAPRLFQVAKEHGLTPLVGSELTMEGNEILPLRHNTAYILYEIRDNAEGATVETSPVIKIINGRRS